MLRFPAVVPLLLASAALAGPVNLSPEEHDRQARVLDQLTKSVAAESGDTAKFAVIARTMKEEKEVDCRARILDFATGLPGADLEAFLTGLLSTEPDAGIRGRAATALGALEFAGEVPGGAGRLRRERPHDGPASGVHRGPVQRARAATFAIAELAAKACQIADDAATKLRLPVSGCEENNEAWRTRVAGDGSFRVTHDDELLKPFFERLKSRGRRGAGEDGVVAFRFLKLKKAPPEVVAALNDASPDVPSWAALVLGEIGDASTGKPLMAIAGDATKDVGLRCNAIFALGSLRYADASDLMERLLKDDDQRVVVNAAISLHRITGKKVKQYPEGYRDD